MQASSIRARYATAAALGMLHSSGFILVTSKAVLCCDRLRRSSMSYQSSLIAMVGGMSQEFNNVVINCGYLSVGEG